MNQNVNGFLGHFQTGRWIHGQHEKRKKASKHDRRIGEVGTCAGKYIGIWWDCRTDSTHTQHFAAVTQFCRIIAQLCDVPMPQKMPKIVFCCSSSYFSCHFCCHHCRDDVSKWRSCHCCNRWICGFWFGLGFGESDLGCQLSCYLVPNINSGSKTL